MTDQPIVNYGDTALYAALRHAPEGATIHVTSEGGLPIVLVKEADRG